MEVLKEKELFLFIKELKPIFTCKTKTLFRREISKLRVGNSVDYFIEPDHVKPFDEAINNLAKGIVLDRYKNFIAEREDSFDSENKIWDPIIKKGKCIKIDFQIFVMKFINSQNNQDIGKHIFEFTDISLSNRN